MDSNPTPEQAADNGYVKLVFKTYDHPEAAGRSPQKGESEYPLTFGLDDGSQLIVRMGEAGFQNVTNLLMMMLANAPSSDDGSLTGISYTDLKAEITRLQAALAEKEKELETWYAANKEIRLDRKIAEGDVDKLQRLLAASQQRVAELAEKHEREMLELIDERDDREDVIERLLATTGFVNTVHYEWSNEFGYEEAISMVEEAIPSIKETIEKLQQAEADRDRYRAALEKYHYAVWRSGISGAVTPIWIETARREGAEIFPALTALATPAATNFAAASPTHPACSEPGKPVESGGDHQSNDSDAQAAKEDLCIFGKTANECAVTACKPYKDEAPKP